MSQTAPTTVTPAAARIARILDRPTTASQDAIAAVAGLSARTVRRALAELEAVGAITRERRVDGRGYRAPDRLVPTGQMLSFGTRSKSKVSNWTPEVIDLRRAMLDAGITCGWSNLRDDVVADLTRWVRTLGISKLVREAKSRIWNAVRHVGAFLRFWRELRPERRPSCPFHPAESTDHGRRCPQCAERPSARMPVELREGRWRSRRSLIQSA